MYIPINDTTDIAQSTDVCVGGGGCTGRTSSSRSRRSFDTKIGMTIVPEWCTKVFLSIGTTRRVVVMVIFRW
jgi:hypothetical protein